MTRRQAEGEKVVRAHTDCTLDVSSMKLLCLLLSLGSAYPKSVRELISQFESEPSGRPPRATRVSQHSIADLERKLRAGRERHRVNEFVAPTDDTREKYKSIRNFFESNAGKNPSGGEDAGSKKLLKLGRGGRTAASLQPLLETGDLPLYPSNHFEEVASEDDDAPNYPPPPHWRTPKRQS
eukprot:Blabericola_migrator_1__2495@NODE_1700_length_3976_cov_130_475058_g1100_i0_p1_GENE_NODE_1700_length_3976_cov_130_475058_g1100_i0NODE_1700_length_3976_cov_130_475058_g1100_i0_p1_ORF_typecomplete_len181_score20_05_NODE_1700_length_3976_cov_130_475058_g1100_i09051447